jgi:hypothetical protein
MATDFVFLCFSALVFEINVEQTRTGPGEKKNFSFIEIYVTRRAGEAERGPMTALTKRGSGKRHISASRGGERDARRVCVMRASTSRVFFSYYLAVN